MEWTNGTEDQNAYETPVDSRFNPKAHDNNPYETPDSMSGNVYNTLTDAEYSCIGSDTDLEKTAIDPGVYLQTTRQEPDIRRLVSGSRRGGADRWTGTCARAAVGALVVLCLLLAVSTGLLAWWYGQCRTANAANSPAVTAARNRPTTRTRSGSSEPGCDDEFVPTNTGNQCYFVSEAEVTKAQAVQQCSDKSSRLLAPNQADPGLAELLVSTPPVSNLARGATCSASSEWDGDYDCEKAIDGSTDAAVSEWVIRGTTGTSAVGSWLLINFAMRHEVSQIQIMTRCYSGYQNKGFQLIFSDETSQSGELTCATGRNRADCAGVPWQTYNVTTRVTSSVKIEITSVCTDRYNGFREVKVIGRPVNSYWTDGVLDGGRWRSGGGALRGLLDWDTQVESTAQDNSCLCLSRRGYLPCTCNHRNTQQTRRFICVKEPVQ